LELAAFLQPGAFVDSDAPGVVRFALTVTAGAADDVERARRLFLAVRDGVRYDPFVDLDDPESYRASAVLAAGHGFCVPKAALLAAAARAVGIASRVSFADVRNHLASPRLRALMDTDVFYWHGYTDLRLDGRWVRATPAFNLALCERFHVAPLHFDGRSDALLQPFHALGRRHLEYVRERGTFADVPFERIRAEFREAYPRAFRRDADPPPR